MASALTFTPAFVLSNADLPSSESQVAADRRAKRKRQAVASGMLAKVRRSRGAPAKPKRRSNRVTISRRVRRKHRRAA